MGSKIVHLPKRVEVIFENCEVYENIAENDILFYPGLESPREKIPSLGDSCIRYDARLILLVIDKRRKDLIDRIIRCRDITWVYLTYDDGSELAFAAPWDDQQAERNTYEKHDLLSDGTLIVTISKRASTCHNDTEHVQEMAR